MKPKKVKRKKIEPKRILREKPRTAVIMGENEHAVIKPVVVEEDDKYVLIKPTEEKEVISEKREEPKEKPEEIIEKETKPKEEEIKPKEREEPKEETKTKREETRKIMREKLKTIPIDMIETDIDKLMVLIEEKKSVSIADLSKELNVGVDQVESWAKILEEHGLIEIEYPIIGLPKLRKKEWKEKS